MNPNWELTLSCPVAEGEGGGGGGGGGAGVRSGLMGHPFSRLIECLLSASSDLFYSPFLPLRFLRSSIFFFPSSLPPVSKLSSLVVCKNARLQSSWLSPVVFLSTS